VFDEAFPQGSEPRPVYADTETQAEHLACDVQWLPLSMNAARVAKAFSSRR